MGLDQDTVPVPESTVDQWTYPPFSATIDKDNWIWGRGVADCQSLSLSLDSLQEMRKLIDLELEQVKTL